MARRWNKSLPRLLPCWDRPMASDKDPVTSHIAAQHARKFQDAQAQKVLEALRRANGSTSDELAQEGLSRYAVARRLSDLRHAGLVRQGEARVSKVSKRLCVTWWVKEGVCT